MGVWRSERLLCYWGGRLAREVFVEEERMDADLS